MRRRSNGCFHAKGIEARWVSGATAEVNTVRLCGTLQDEFHYTLNRAAPHSGFDKDLEFAERAKSIRGQQGIPEAGSATTAALISAWNKARADKLAELNVPDREPASVVDDCSSGCAELPEGFRLFDPHAPLHEAAMEGEVEAQFQLGLHYFGFVWMDADSGLTEGEIAIFEENAKSAHIEGIRWITKAAQQGHARAQNNLGYRYSRGRGVAQDYAEAARWYRLAAEQGDADSQSELGFLLYVGKGVLQDRQEAARWFHMAAASEEPYAQFSLGSMYAHGRGVTQDYVQAHMWFNLAAARGYEKAEEQRDILSRRMSAAQLAEAQRLARAWRPGGKTASERSPSQAPEKPELAATGTGFVISVQGHVLTNEHVVDDCREIRVGTKAGGAQIAKLVTSNSRDDLAVLRLPKKPAQLTPARFRIQPAVRQGESSAVYGFPLSGTLASGGNLTTGNVTALAGLGDDPRFFQISAPVQPGNSGGPLLDMSGAVIGVVVAKLDALKVASVTEDIPQNVNFAIKSSIALNLLDSLGIGYQTAPNAPARSAADVADIARQFTLQVLCYR
jgi:S1-C subfamily serine protease